MYQLTRAVFRIPTKAPKPPRGKGAFIEDGFLLSVAEEITAIVLLSVAEEMETITGQAPERGANPERRKIKKEVHNKVAHLLNQPHIHYRNENGNPKLPNRQQKTVYG